MRNPSGGAPSFSGRIAQGFLCPSMRNPSGGAPRRLALRLHGGYGVSIDEKPVRRCARSRARASPRRPKVSIDEKPVRRCAGTGAQKLESVLLCPSMRNPSGGAPLGRCAPGLERSVSIDEKPVRRCAVGVGGVGAWAIGVSIDEKPVRRCAHGSQPAGGLFSSVHR